MASMLTPNPGWRRRRRPVPPVLLAFVGTLCLHVLFFLALAFLPVPEPEPREAKDVQVAMRPISAAEWARNRGEAPDAPASKSSQQQAQVKPAPEKKKEPEKRPEGQVVDVAPGNGEESPDAEYLAESSNKVQKETRAKEQTPHYRNAMPKRTTTVPNENVGRDAVEKAQRAGNDGLGNDDRPLNEASEKKLAMEIPDIQARDEVRLEKSPGEGPGPQIADRRESAEVQGNSNRLKLQEGLPGSGEDGSQGRAGRPGVLTLTPSFAALDSISGAAPNDHLDGVDEGEGTYLNTREWKYASFFNRVKQSVGRTWNPVSQLRQRDPTGNMYGSRDRYTLLEVRLTERGEVKDVHVLKSSGLDFLDLEAMQSFYRAQSFPNPPPGMLEPDSTVRFQFGFFLELGGSSRLRLYRSN